MKMKHLRLFEEFSADMAPMTNKSIAEEFAKRHANSPAGERLLKDLEVLLKSDGMFVRPDGYFSSLPTQDPEDKKTIEIFLKPAGEYPSKENPGVAIGKFFVTNAGFHFLSPEQAKTDSIWWSRRGYPSSHRVSEDNPGFGIMEVGIDPTEIISSPVAKEKLTQDIRDYLNFMKSGRMASKEDLDRDFQNTRSYQDATSSNFGKMPMYKR